MFHGEGWFMEAGSLCFSHCVPATRWKSKLFRNHLQIKPASAADHAGYQLVSDAYMTIVTIKNRRIDGAKQMEKETAPKDCCESVSTQNKKIT